MLDFVLARVMTLLTTRESTPLLPVGSSSLVRWCDSGSGSLPTSASLVSVDVRPVSSALRFSESTTSGSDDRSESVRFQGSPLSMSRGGRIPASPMMRGRTVWLRKD